MKNLDRFNFAILGHVCPVCNTIYEGEISCDCEGVLLKSLCVEAIKEVRAFAKEHPVCSCFSTCRYEGQNILLRSLIWRKKT
ncbi:MAG: hypothetical protein Q8O88_00850 [bacterium]|nr:hypothetical protein [bacterium]